MTPYLDDGDVRLYLGDCVEVMADMGAESVDAVVTDPPYALIDVSRNGSPRTNVGKSGNPYAGGGARAGGFMGKVWDTGDVAFDPDTWRAALRVLRPGGHLLAFGGTRTFHRLTCAIEDAGFEVRDCLSWNYGSGFPKSLDVSKAIDRAAGAEREVVGEGGPFGRGSMRNRSRVEQGYRPTEINPDGGSATITTPATPEAATWQGWGTALKPAWEPIVLARKPLAGTVAGNVLAHGTGAINVDGCRVGTTGATRKIASEQRGPSAGTYGNGLNGGGGERDLPFGRWPANVVLSHTPECREVGERNVRRNVTIDGSAPSRRGGYGEGWGDHPRSTTGVEEMVPAFDCSPDCPVRMLDEQAGERPTGHLTRKQPAVGWNGAKEWRDCDYGGDSGGPSRFFYTSKASSAERDGASHPTVKPLALMRWLVRLVTPPGGLVLDPFAGSGTTGLACREEGFRAVLIEREEEYAKMAAHRLRQLSLLGELT